ncbi:MAG: type II and III secretion system protein family protein [Beijerinckiaceae bacterium]|nr:type II and III secretion system protein family protein [Beijerinckiaceae bacterium]
MFKPSRFTFRAARSLSAFALAMLAAAPVAAQTQRENAATSSEARQGQRLSMGIGKSVIIDLPRDASEIFVGNPAVANAVVRSPRKLYVIGMANGQTTIFALDAGGGQIAKIEINIGRDVGELQRILRAALPASDISARTVEDSIILTGNVATAGDAQKAVDIANGFVRADATQAGAPPGGAASSSRVVNSLVIRGRDQVMLKVTISEVQRQVLKQLGVNAASATGGWGRLVMDNPFSLNLQNTSSSALTLNGAGDLQTTLRAFERYGVARVLAEPSVTAISGESAKFMAGGELPIPQGQSCTPDQSGRITCTTSVSFKPYGISLNFTPVVLSEGRILMRIATEVTEVDQTQSFTFSSVNVPAFRTRKNETSVELPSGGSIVSAGLIQMKSRQVINGLPGLMSLPILGAAFRSRDFQREESELLIIVTPYIAKAVNPNEIARPDDGFMEASDPQTWFLGRVNRLYSTKSNPQAAQGLKGRFGFIID